MTQAEGTTRPPSFVSSVQYVIGMREVTFLFRIVELPFFGSYARSADGCVWIPFATSASKFPSTLEEPERLEVLKDKRGGLE